ncbi:hypothetical protein, partial [Actinophytocola sp.]|uniref:hypothetical protein n=1 Tax=Actinophytocola sp. TaxID=1872138 RepID=UPI002D7E4811
MLLLWPGQRRGVVEWRARVAGFMPRPTPRVTNLALLAVLVLAFATGVGSVAAGAPGGRWVVVAHGIVAMAVILLTPWKSTVVRRGLRRTRRTRWLSLVLAGLAVTTLLSGLAYTTGLVRSVGGVLVMWLHVAAALALTGPAVWHVLARRARPRRTDLSRRSLVRGGVFAAAAGGLYLGQAGLERLAGLPGAGRRFTGSYDAGSFDPAAMPSYSWLDD